MEITVVIDDSMLEEPVRKQVAIAVNMEVRNAVNKKVASMTSEIEGAVEKYLVKSLTDDQIKEVINSEVIAQMAERIRRLTDE